MTEPMIIKMMNEKLDELTARGVPVFQAKLLVAMAMIETLRQSGIGEDDVMKFAEIIAR